MSATAPGSPEIRDYLLRRMTETARARFEEAYFRDDRLLDQIESEEDLLVADYVMGRLEEGERKLFEKSLLDTPYYKERVETTRGIRLRLAEERFFKKKTRAAAAPPSPDAHLFPRGTGFAVGASLLVLVTVASLLSAFFLKRALGAARRELVDRAPRPEAAAQAGVVPTAQTVVLPPETGTGPSIVRVRRPAGGALLLVFPQASAAPPGAAYGVSLTSAGRVVWDSGDLPAKEPESGAFSLRLPPGVPPSDSYAVRLRVRGAGAAQDVSCGTLDVRDR